jgi:2-polyprenyl-3-methyl-5-hydroxy-6-metoxy-1,4-benzoquinol methylase
VDGGQQGVGEDTRDRIYDNAGNEPLLALAPAVPGRALDCGCGAGANARLLRARGWEVTGITLSPRERELAAPHCARVLLADLEEGLPDDVGTGYDLVVLSHVLEHLRHPERLLGAVKRLLQPEGVVLVALPNALFYPIRLRVLVGRCDYERDGILDETHLHFYSLASGAALLERSGLRLLEARAEGGVPLRWIRRLLSPEAVTRIDAAACRWRPSLFGRQVLYRAAPSGRPGTAV